MEYAVIAAAALTGLIVLVIVNRLRSSGSAIGAEALLLISFAITYPVSALVHLLGSAGQARGFADLVRGVEGYNAPAVWLGLGLVFVAEAALVAGLGRPNRRSSARLEPCGLPFLLWGATFASLGLYGTFRVFSGEANLFSALATLDRAREFGGGEARYYFVSRWFGWGVTFLAVWFLNRRSRPESWTVKAVLTLSTLAIVLSIFWRGGRSEAVLAVAPLWLFVARAGLHPRTRMALVLAAAGGLYVGAVSVLRATVDAPLSQTTIEIADWHAGRFSMIGPTLQVEAEEGWLWGETLAAGIVDTLNAPFVLAGISAPIPPPRRITSVFGAFLRRDENVNGIVPGFLSELYLNFGFTGVAVGFALLGYAGRRLGRTTMSSTHPSALLLSLYLGILLATGAIPGTATGWVYVLFTYGLPVVCLSTHEALVGQRRFGFRQRPLPGKSRDSARARTRSRSTNSVHAH